MNRGDVLELLAGGMNDYERRLNRRTIIQWADDFMGWSEANPPESEAGYAPEPAERLMLFLKFLAGRKQKEIHSLQTCHAEFLKRHSHALTATERHEHVLQFALDLGAGARQIRGDKKAFSRWFGKDSVVDRYEKQLHSLEHQFTFCLDRMGAMVETILAGKPTEKEKADHWNRLSLDEFIKPLLAYDGDKRVSTAAFRCLARALRSLPDILTQTSVDQGTIQFIYRSTLHSNQDVWLQREALDVLQTLSPESLHKVLKRRLEDPLAGEDIFVRKRAVELIVDNLRRCRTCSELMRLAADDASPFVRQGFANALAGAPPAHVSPWLERLALEDPAPQVRAAGLLAAGKLLRRRQFNQAALRIIRASLQQEKDAFVLRVAIQAAVEGASFLLASRDGFSLVWCDEMSADLERLHLNAEATRVRRWAAQARENIWCEANRDARKILHVFRRCSADLNAGESIAIPGRLVEPYTRDTVGRVLSVLSQNDFGFEAEFLRDGIRLTRGNIFGFRWWRFLHEMRNPSPDKRQGFPHTVGRWFRGSVRAPSGILGELSETKIPGEPLCMADEGGWRPYLPLPDEFLSMLASGFRRKSFRTYTSEGMTEVLSPDAMLKRLRAYFKLTWRYPHYARLRNWRTRSQDNAASYLQGLADLGFVVRLHDYSGHDGNAMSLDPQVKHFFPALLPFIDTALWDQLRDYFFSLYENSLFDLCVFTGIGLALFMGRHYNANRSLRKARNSIPLVVGGWGTRGKSGTERLKAALFNALGYGLVCKTTGCEAMFLYAHPFGGLHEMFLFRPYDKATIWEQSNVVKLASELKVEVLLWECMGLTPEYIDILQRQWMRDDLSTITNAYPDHEDLQGPAGFNIPEVMSLFIPEKGKLLTSEELMLPILAEGARKKGTCVKAATWLESGLLTEDVLDRFPYEEHPSNIALVLSLAEELGVDRDFALKEMADRVVPDLGVLKTYPVSRLRGRRLQFTNGMSANDRHGAIGNWTRMGFDGQDACKEPGVWVSAVVNNRADRIPRSKVFARLMVEDFSVDRYFLIGNNLKGLRGYIHKEWEGYVSGLSLWPGHVRCPDSPEDILRREAGRLRMPRETQHVYGRLSAMFADSGPDPELADILEKFWRQPAALEAHLRKHGIEDGLPCMIRHHQENLQACQEYGRLMEQVQCAAESGREALDREFRGLLTKWFEGKLVVVEDYYISGDNLISLICEETPPGYLNRIMGLQNIKGTGLDLVYRWQNWDACWKACTLLRSRKQAESKRGVSALVAMSNFSILCEEQLAEALDAVKQMPFFQSESIQAELSMIKSNLALSLDQFYRKSSGKRRSGRFRAMCLNLLEGIFDPGDSVKRRKTANKIYRDIVAERISNERAVEELKRLTQRQKGGWLGKMVESMHRDIMYSLKPAYSDKPGSQSGQTVLKP